MAYAIKLKIPNELKAAFANPKGIIEKQLSEGIKEAATNVQREIKKNVIPGWNIGHDSGPASIFTGKLNRNILSEMIAPLKARVGVSASIPYGAIQEYGGIIKPKNAKALFIPTSQHGRKVGPVKGGGSGLIYGEDFIFMQSVEIKPKTYFSRGIDKAIPTIKKVMQATVDEIVRIMGFK